MGTSSDQCPVARCHHDPFVFGFEPDDQRNLAKRGRGSAVCVASAARGIRGLGGRTKDVLCAFFWMLTLWFYAQYAAKPCTTRYLATLGSFALCLMAKPMGVTLPFVLLLLDYWPLKRISDFGFRISDLKKLLLEKVPFLVLSAIACLLTVSAQELAIVSTAGLPVSQRLFHVLAAYDHYLVAMFVPLNLAVYYPYQIHIPTLTLFAPSCCWD